MMINIFFLGKDAAGIAMEAINFARDAKVDIVLVDTAGRMQDNEPLMRALTKVSLGLECDMNYETNEVYDYS
jgi:signal recognition particle GTPase